VLPGAGREDKSMPDDFRVHVGTSGWHYKHWVGDFYPERFPSSKMFSWYAREFHTVEINNSFYRLPEGKTFQQWREMAPPGFLFALKASRFITHIKRLRDAADSIDLFFSRAKPLGLTLGPVLFQLPPRWKANVDRLAEFLSILPKRHKYSIEFRDESWNAAQVYALLRRHNIALCIHDWHEMPWSKELTADFSYIRFHGSGQNYGGNYPKEQLRAWAKWITSWSRQLSDVFVYFNNDIGGHAIRNARSLRTLLEGEVPASGKPDRMSIGSERTSRLGGEDAA
jgi:uncharacterized protein YecE (DUF72 family)